jgi:hypothetical protein
LARITAFDNAIKKRIARHRIRPNLLPLQQAGLSFLRNNPELKVWSTDKNLGPIVTTADVYIQRAFSDHLDDSTTYRELSDSQVNGRILAIHTMLRNFVASYHSVTTTYGNRQSSTPTPTGKFLLESLKTPDPFAYFYMLAKIHKDPWSTRPVTSVSRSLLHGLGRWVDQELQKIITKLPFVTQSSATLIEMLDTLPLQPSNARLFTADARLMYTNIQTTHALSVIGSFFDEPMFSQKFPGVNPSALLKGLEIVMNNDSLFKFTGRTFLQLSGCAMGTPPAPPYATLYFYLHERSLIPAFPSCTFYTRYIDDVFGIWTPTNPATASAEWTSFKSTFDTFGRLRWDFSPPSRSVVFLDLRISISDGGKITTDLFEKNLNLHLYLPPASMHPPGVLKGLVKGALFRIDTLCHSPERRLHHKKMFFKRLYRRGYRPATILPLLRRHDKKSIPVQSNERQLFLHCDFTPSKNWSTIRSIFSSTVAHPPSEPPLPALRNRFGHRLDPYRLIVAYHRLPNLRNLLCARKFRNDSFRILPSVPTLVSTTPLASIAMEKMDCHVEPRQANSLVRPSPALGQLPSTSSPTVSPTDEAKAKQIV